MAWGRLSRVCALPVPRRVSAPRGLLGHALSILDMPGGCLHKDVCLSKEATRWDRVAWLQPAPADHMGVLGY